MKVSPAIVVDTTLTLLSPPPAKYNGTEIEYVGDGPLTPSLFLGLLSDSAFDRNRFMLAFKTLAWETAATEAGGDVNRRSAPAPKPH